MTFTVTLSHPHSLQYLRLDAFCLCGTSEITFYDHDLFWVQKLDTFSPNQPWSRYTSRTVTLLCLTNNASAFLLFNPE